MFADSRPMLAYWPLGLDNDGWQRLKKKYHTSMNVYYNKVILYTVGSE